MTPIIRPETPDDVDAVRHVNCRAFGGAAEAQLVDALRDGGFSRISLVAELDGAVVGHILFSSLTIVTAEADVPAVALAPLAVLPPQQRRGIGSRLVREGLLACARDGHRIVIVVGHPGFYARFGFSSERAARLSSPYSGRSFMAAELAPGALESASGEVRYPPPFAGL